MTTNPYIPVALHTAPSGKVLKWGVEGAPDGLTFKTKGAALAWMAENTPEAGAPAMPEGVLDSLSPDKAREARKRAKAALTPEGRVLALSPDELPPVPTDQPKWQESRAPASRAPKAPKEAPEPTDYSALVDGFTLVASPGARFERVMAGDKSLGYLYPVPRPGRPRRLEVRTSLLTGAPTGLLRGTTPRQSQTLVLVTPGNMAQARALLEHARDTEKAPRAAKEDK